MYKDVSNTEKLILIDFLNGLKLVYNNSFTILSLILKKKFFLRVAAMMKLYHLFNEIRLTE